MKWYAYNDTGSTVNLFLDHNTTNSVKWQSSGDTRDGIGEVQTRLESDTSTWQSSLGARLITYDEIDSIAPGGPDLPTWNEMHSPTQWLAGWYWTSTPVPSTFWDSWYDEDGDGCYTNDYSETYCYYNFAYYAEGVMEQDGWEQYLLVGPNADIISIGSGNSTIIKVDETAGVRPVITITR